MKIKAEKWIVDENISYKIISIEKCCNKLINSKNVILNNQYDEEYVSYMDDDNNNDYSVKLIRKETDYDGYEDYYYETIKYCPFCGEPIEIEIVNTIDKTEEYLQLQDERTVFWDKCCRTDSKKKEEKLRQQVRELDEKINKMLESDDFRKEV